MAFSQGLTSDQIRKGLLSIRNSQAELLNELKNETHILKKFSPGLAIPEENQSEQEEKKGWSFNYPQYRPFSSDISQENINSSNQILQSSIKSSKEKDLQQENKYLKNESKLLNSNAVKLKTNYEAEKERAQRLSEYIQTTSKLYYQVIDQILQEISLEQIKRIILNDLRTNSSLYAKTSSSELEKILRLIQFKECNAENMKNQKEDSQKQLAIQVMDLRNQLQVLVRANLSKTEAQIALDQQINRLQKQINQQNHVLQQYSKRIAKLEGDNKQLLLLCQKEREQRRKVIQEWQKIKRESLLWEDKQRKIIFYAKEMDDKRVKIEQQLKEKQVEEESNKESIKKLTETVNFLREDNQNLRKQISNLQETREKHQKLQSESKKQVESDQRMLIQQQQSTITNYEREITSLRNHIAEIKKNQEALLLQEKKNKENQLIQQEIYWRKVNTVRANSAIDHLWMVKQIEYANINDILRLMNK